MYGGFILPCRCQSAAAFIGLPFGSFWDAAALTILLRWPLPGRMFLNGCSMAAERRLVCAVAAGPPRHLAAAHPTQLMEMAFALVLFGAALALRNSAPFPARYFAWLAGYGGGAVSGKLRETRPAAATRRPLQATSILW